METLRRTAPLPYWTIAAMFAIAGWLTKPPLFLITQSGSHGYWNTSQFYAGPVVLAYNLLCLAAALAPVVVLRFWWTSVACALAPLLVSIVTLSPAAGFNAFLAMVGVMVCSTWKHPRRARILLPLALVIPALLAFAPRFVLWVGQVSNTSDAWSANARASTFGVYLIAVLAALGIGLLVRSTILRHAEVDRRGVEVEVRDSEVSERAQLARDLHDVVAHRISLIAVRAETAPYQHPELDDTARVLLTDTATDARLALDEMRNVLGVLQRSGEAASTTPQPTSAQIAQLISDAQSSGAKVSVDGELPQLDSLAGTTAYRVVQEALTNARRHEPLARTTVTFTGDEDADIIEIRNTTAAEAFEVGRGLAGMRERLRLVGGSLTTTLENGEFVLTATMPRSTY